jgi:ABC-type Fe3+ transport system permease subunit
VFVLLHSVMWPLALNTYAGFRAVPETLRMTGCNYGLGGVRLMLQILIPAALPAILSGLKIGWAFAWRTRIAAELVFGTTSGQGGLGWYIFQSRNELYTDKVFAGQAAVIVIGLLVENLVFQSVERLTVRRWGCSARVCAWGKIAVRRADHAALHVQRHAGPGAGLPEHRQVGLRFDPFDDDPGRAVLGQQEEVFKSGVNTA